MYYMQIYPSAITVEMLEMGAGLEERKLEESFSFLEHFL